MMRILVAFEEDQRAYRDKIAAAIQMLRPGAEVETAELGGLGDHIERFDPELVIYTRANSVDPGGRRAWVEVSVDPIQPTKMWVSERYSERTNPTLEVLLALIDEIEEPAQTSSDFRYC
jgi:hypothetical protein